MLCGRGCGQPQFVLGIAFRRHRDSVPQCRDSIPFFRGSVPPFPQGALLVKDLRAATVPLPFFYPFSTHIGLWKERRHTRISPTFGEVRGQWSGAGAALS